MVITCSNESFTYLQHHSSQYHMMYYIKTFDFIFAECIVSQFSYNISTHETSYYIFLKHLNTFHIIYGNEVKRAKRKQVSIKIDIFAFYILFYFQIYSCLLYQNPSTNENRIPLVTSECRSTAKNPDIQNG